MGVVGRKARPSPEVGHELIPRGGCDGSAPQQQDRRRSMPTESSVRVLRTLAELEEIRQEWESWPGHRDSDIDFFSTRVSSNPATVRPHVIVAYRDGRPDAILVGRIDLTLLPLKIGYWKLPSRRVRLLDFAIGAQRGNCSAEASQILLREALDCLRRGEADLGRLDFVRVDSPLYQLARSLPGVLERDRGAVPQPHWSMQLAENCEEVLNGLSQSLRYELKHKTKRIEADFASVVVKCFEKPDELDILIRDVESIAAKSYQRSIGVGFHNSEPMRQRLLFEAKKGWLLAYVLYVENVPRAFWIGTLYDDVFYGQFIGFDEEFSDHSPGTVLQAKGLEDICARQVRGIDFGPGDAQYKARFGSTCHEEASLFLFPPTFRGVALNLLRTLTALANETAKGVAGRAGALPAIKRILRGKKSNHSKPPSFGRQSSDSRCRQYDDGRPVGDPSS